MLSPPKPLPLDGRYDPTKLLVGYGSIQLALGAYTCFLPNETANKNLQDFASDGNTAAPLMRPLAEHEPREGESIVR